MNLEEAISKLDDAVVQVARTAQELVDNASRRTLQTFEVPSENIEEMKEVLATWKQATQSFLEVVCNKNQ